MNKWKTRFWICFALLISVTLIGSYVIIDQGVTLTYVKDGYQETDNDLNTLMVLINETDFSKTSIKEKLQSHAMYEQMDFNTNEVQLDCVTLFFKDDKLSRIKRQK
jgi:hypothetical protein